MPAIMTGRLCSFGRGLSGNGDQDQANVYYQRIIEDYADTDAAQSAQEALDEQNGTSSDENAEDGAGQDSSSESSGEN